MVGHDLSGAPDSGLDIVVLPGCMAIEWAGLAKVHSDQLYYSRPDVNADWWSGGACLRRWTG